GRLGPSRPAEAPDPGRHGALPGPPVPRAGGAAPRRGLRSRRLAGSSRVLPAAGQAFADEGPVLARRARDDAREVGVVVLPVDQGVELSPAGRVDSVGEA